MMMVCNGTSGFAKVRVGSEPARTANQTKGRQALNRRMLSKNGRLGFLCGSCRTNLKAGGSALAMIVL
jgi:hypothetical protein